MTPGLAMSMAGDSCVREDLSLTTRVEHLAMSRAVDTCVREHTWRDTSVSDRAMSFRKASRRA